MNIVIAGVGGIGGYYGGRLAAAGSGAGGSQVEFFCRGAHLEVIREKGLEVRAADGTFTARPAFATDRADELSPCDLLLVCVKTYDLAETIRSLRPPISPATIVLPLANGVNNAQRIRDIVPDADVLNGLVYISSFIEAPGVIRQIGGSRALVFGPENGGTERCAAIETLLRGAGINATLSSNVRLDVWSKFIFLSALAAVTTLTGKNFGDLQKDAESMALLKELMEEIRRVGNALGVSFPADAADSALGKFAGFPPETKTSMQLDAERGKRTELSELVGSVVEMGARAGVATPRYAEVFARLREKVRS